MKLKQILNEIISDKLWHFTKLENAVNIITQNEFLLTLAFKSDYSNDSKEKYYFMSTARQRYDGYGKDYQCRLELDGRLLSNNYRGKAFKFFKTTGKKDTEFEDRIFSDTPSIKNAIHYIKQVDLYIPISHLKSGALFYYLDLIELCVEKNVKCVLFFTNENYKSGRNGFIITNNTEYQDFLNSTDYDSINDIRKIKTKQKKHVKTPDSPLYSTFYIYILKLQGVNIQTIETLFLNNKKNKDNFEENIKDINWSHDTEYKDYEDFINTGFNETKIREISLKEDLKDEHKRNTLHTTISLNIKNKYKTAGPVEKELLDLILRNARREQVRLPDLLDYIEELIVNDLNEN